MEENGRNGAERERRKDADRLPWNDTSRRNETDHDLQAVPNGVERRSAEREETRGGSARLDVGFAVKVSGVPTRPPAWEPRANAPAITPCLRTKQLPTIGVQQQFISFTNVTMESEKFICVRETASQGASQNSLVIVDMDTPMQPLRRPISADSALMNPTSKIIALKASVQGTSQEHLQVFNIELKAKVKSYQMNEQVVFWKWISQHTLGIVTATAVYHWSIEGSSEPTKIFERTANLNGTQIISYKTDPTMKWCVLIGIAPGAPERPQLVKGFMQLYSVDQQRSQALEAHAASFATVRVPGNVEASTVIAFASKTIADGQIVSKIHVIELGAQQGRAPFQKQQKDLFFPPDFQDDFPVSMLVSDKYGLIYVVTKLGLLFVYDLATATAIYRSRISPDPVFLAVDAPSNGGFYAINRRGQVLLATVNEQTMVPFIAQQLQNLELALAVARRGNLPGAESLTTQNFERLFSMGRFKEAAELAAESPQAALRTKATIERFKSVPPQPGQTSPLLQYFGILLTKGRLNEFETVELGKLVLQQNKKQLLDNWFKEEKLTSSEELGDMVSRAGDNDMALKIYEKAQATPKVIAAYASIGDLEKVVEYSGRVGYTPDYLYLMQTLLMNNPDGALKLAQMLVKQPDPPLEINAIADLFLQRNMVREATTFLLEVLKPDLEEHAMLQTKVLEINLVAFPNVADAILANGMFSHYDKPRVAQLAEKAGLYMRALQHYTELPDIKRVVVNTHAIEPQQFVEYFGTLSPEWALECLKELMLTNARQNLQLVVQVCKEYSDQLGNDNIIKLFEEFKSYEGLFYFIGGIIAFSQDSNVHFKYIEAATKINQLKEVERITRESSVYDPEKVKRFLMDVKLPDARPLINVCDRHGFVSDLTHYLYANNMLRYIEGYVQKVNPSSTPDVVGQLLDDEADTTFITNLILSVRSLLPVEQLVDVVEKRNRLKLLTQFLEHLVGEGSKDTHVHNALGKIIVDANNNPEHFLTTNPYYDSKVVGKFCEKRDPNLACIAYKRGECDMELIEVTNKNSMFKAQSRYIVERMDPALWETVLDESNPYRRQLIDQTVSTALPESRNPEQVSVTVKAFMTAELPHELIELLEKIVLQSSAFSGNPNLQNLLILTAIKADQTRVMDYVNRLDSFDGPAVGEIAVNAELYEEAFVIYKKFNLNVQAIRVLLDNVESLERAHEFATKVEEAGVWSELARAQLEQGFITESITSYIRAGDPDNWAEVISAARGAECYEQLVKFLLMARKKIKEEKVDEELIYSYAKIGQIGAIEEFIAGSHLANINTVGDRCFFEEMYEAAKLLYTSISAWGSLASTLVKLHQFQQAVDAARKANSGKTWKEVCFACVDEGEFRLAQVCGLNIIINSDDLEQVSEYYQKKGKFEELIALLESGIGLDRAHMGIFTELGIIYAKYMPIKLMEHLKLFSSKLNIPKLIRVCEEQQHWKELAYLYVQYDEYDNALMVMINHSPEAWDHLQFKDVAVKVANMELYYKAVNFYLEEQPQLLNDMLNVLSSRIDHARVVDIVRKAGHLPLIRTYLNAVQDNNLVSVNEAINELCIEEEDFDALRESINTYDNFDQIQLALKIENHELIEFRRIASHIYKKNLRWRQSVDLSKKDKLYKDAMETVAESGESELSEELLTFFIEEDNKECFAACLFTCYDLVKPDVALELAWLNGYMEYAMPYLIQFVREYSSKVDMLVADKADRRKAEEAESAKSKAAEVQANMHAPLLPPGLPAPNMPMEQHGQPTSYGQYTPMLPQFAHNGMMAQQDAMGGPPMY